GDGQRGRVAVLPAVARPLAGQVDPLSAVLPQGVLRDLRACVPDARVSRHEAAFAGGDGHRAGLRTGVLRVLPRHAVLDAAWQFQPAPRTRAVQTPLNATPGEPDPEKTIFDARAVRRDAVHADGCPGFCGGECTAGPGAR